MVFAPQAITFFTLLWSSAVLSACTDSGTSTIKSNEDATALASCTTFAGSLALATGVAGDVSLDGLQEVSGNVKITDTEQLVSFSSDSLQKIGGTFTIQNTTVLSTLDLPKLSNVGNISWAALPNIQSLGFEAGIDLVSIVTIENTELRELTAFNVKQADQIVVSNNPYMTKLSIPLSNVNGSIVIDANGNNMTALFPNMQTANNVSISNVSSLSMPRLSQLDGTILFRGNTFQTLALPSLSVIKGMFALLTNPELENLTLSSLLSVGSVQIANNSELAQLSVDQLGTIDAGVVITGNFTNVTIPKLDSVGGSFSLQSSNDDMSCDEFDSYQADQVIKGKYQCVGRHSNATANVFNTPISSSSGLTTGAKAGIGVGATIGALALLGGGAFVLLRRTKRSSETAETYADTKDEKRLGEMLEDDLGKAELGNGNEAQELPAEHGVSEVETRRAPVVHKVPGTYELDA